MLRLLALPILLTAIVSGTSFASGPSFTMYVGTYDAGIYGFTYQPGVKEVKPIGLMGELPNPSFLAVDSAYKTLYAVSEEDRGTVASFGIDRRTGKLQLRNKVSTKGGGPCHLSVDKTGRILYVANYGSGSVAVVPIESEGQLSEASQLIQLKGSGPVTDRQEGPHAHEVVISADQRFVFVPDLGADKVRVFAVNAGKHELESRPDLDAMLPPGTGPRHIAFGAGSRFVYVLGEINSMVTTFRYEAGKFTRVAAVTTLPAGVVTKNDTAEIAYANSTGTVYTSNRGHNSISVFHADSKTGTLSMVQNISTMGDEPRFFTIDPTGHKLFVGNQKSNRINLFDISKDGRLKSSRQVIDVPTPVCMLFVPAR